MYRKFIFLIATLFFLNACASQKISMDTLYQSNNCGDRQAGLSVIKEQQVLDEIVNNNSQSLISGQKNASRESRVLKNGYNHFLIAMGIKPTAGYSLYLDDSNAIINNGQLEIPVKETHVAEGNIAATVITSPCMIIAIEKANYKSIKAGNYIEKL